MRLPIAAHTQRPWRIHRVAPDFAVLDVWAYRTPGAGPHDLATMLSAIQASATHDSGPSLTRLLFAVRWKLGELFGWDSSPAAVPSLAERLPDDLRRTDTATSVPGLPFTLLYQTRDEVAMEVINRTVHGIAHLGWVRTRDGDYQLRMAVLVRPNGLLGRAYLAAIAPFRHLIVYPAMTRQWERAWRERAGSSGAVTPLTENPR
ncbi:DUF2867 domain-containing protein [Mycolicibacterium frederiksbergense]|uniref:DUF2867 domain-containing protein n=1 Tax=Mycolicibacterium frederiksbergense TaxID=117567 RepID=A0A6H0S7B6_9MYCO|nr:DUF2867 domain-containing protein [Mycolicibacterium frederiksbergense]QIV83056.1 DUF2867 domain-containing protein [Mycolicibacterium frederiksbergense]